MWVTASTGLRVQMLADSAEANRTLEAEFARWAKAVGLPEKLQDQCLRLRFRASQARGDLKAAVESCEKMVAHFSGGAKPDKTAAAHWQEELAGVWLLLDHNYAKAEQAWLQRNQLAGESDKDWPYWPPLKDVPNGP